MEKVIVINYKATNEVLFKISKYIFLNSKLVKYFKFGFPFIVIINILSNTILEENTKISILDYAFPIVILPLVFWFLYYRTMREIKNKIKNNHKNLEDIKVTLYVNSFKQEGQTFMIETFWKDVIKIKETKEWFLIFQTDYSAFPIFKNELSREQDNDINELFRSLNVKKSLLN